MKNQFSSGRNHDCGCNAALRYDIYKSEKNFYSEMLLAREINSENYRELSQQIGGGLSLFGIEVGASGENLEKIKSIYAEKLLNVNISNEVSKYESITTSNVSYDAYKFCIEKCLKANLKGVDAYIISENADAVVIGVMYNGEQRSQALEIKYGIEANNPEVISLESNTSGVVRIQRKSLKAFTVIFESKQYEPVKVTVKEYKPITALMTLTYRETIIKEMGSRTYTASSDDNDNKKPTPFELPTRIQNELDIVNGLVNRNDGAYMAPGLSEGGKYTASLLSFKFSSSNGEKLKNPRSNCNGVGCRWVEARPIIVNNENVVAQYFRAFGLPVTMTYTVDTYKEVIIDREVVSFTTNDEITFIVPKTSSDVIIHHKDGAIPAGESNDHLELLDKKDTENIIIYRYSIKSMIASKSFFIE